MIQDYIFEQWTPEKNCWWLVRDYYFKYKETSIPEYYEGLPTHFEKVRQIKKGLESDWIENINKEESCLVAMGRTETIVHVGIWLPCEKKILHLNEGVNCRVETYSQIKKLFPAIKFYKYARANH